MGWTDWSIAIVVVGVAGLLVETIRIRLLLAKILDALHRQRS